MAKKAATKGASGAASPRLSKPAAAGVTRRATIRMYRLGVGDCFLVSFPRAGQDDFRILIDCGVHQAQPGGGEQVKKAVQDLKTIIKNGKFDVVVGTHEHQDHLSGFPEIKDVFGEGCARETWVAWTEDDSDEFAKGLKTHKEKALTALYGARRRMQAAGAADQAAQLRSLLGFFGDDSGPKLKTFGAALKSLSKEIKYLKPGGAPIEIVEDQVRAFVLGPPRRKDLLDKSDPSKKEKDQVYFGAYAGLVEPVASVLDEGPERPFGDRFSVRLEGSTALQFFKQYYWADKNGEELEDRIDDTQDWRRIDADWMDTATTLAMQLDKDTNNTSLVLAFELGPKKEGGPVLLFAADAQVGNWLSWKDVTWTFEGRPVSGPDLLKRTILYKVGHHASQNATLNEGGLELMTVLELALVPTDAKMAETVKWGTLPWKPLLDQLTKKTKGAVIRTDTAFGTQTLPVATVIETPLYYEIEI